MYTIVGQTAPPLSKESKYLSLLEVEDRPTEHLGVYSVEVLQKLLDGVRKFDKRKGTGRVELALTPLDEHRDALLARPFDDGRSILPSFDNGWLGAAPFSIKDRR